MSKWHPGQRAALPSSSFFATAAFVGRALLCSMQNTHLQGEEGELGPRIRYLVPFLLFSLLCVFRQSRRRHHQRKMSVTCQNFFPHYNSCSAIKIGFCLQRLAVEDKPFLLFSPFFCRGCGFYSFSHLQRKARERKTRETVV